MIDTTISVGNIFTVITVAGTIFFTTGSYSTKIDSIETESNKTVVRVKATEKDRDIIALRNFPIRRSFRQLQKFFLPNSHEKVRNDYYLALYELLKLYHSKGQKYFLK